MHIVSRSSSSEISYENDINYLNVWLFERKSFLRIMETFLKRFFACSNDKIELENIFADSSVAGKFEYPFTFFFDVGYWNFVFYM